MKHPRLRSQNSKMGSMATCDFVHTCIFKNGTKISKKNTNANLTGESNSCCIYTERKRTRRHFPVTFRPCSLSASKSTFFFTFKMSSIQNTRQVMFKLGVCRIKSEALTTSTLTRKCEQGLRTFSVLFTSGGKDQRKFSFTFAVRLSVNTPLPYLGYFCFRLYEHVRIAKKGSRVIYMNAS